MPLPKKPRVPIYSSPAKFVTLMESVVAASESLVGPMTLEDNHPAIFVIVEGLSAKVNAAKAKYLEGQDDLMEYKQTVIQRNNAFDAVGQDLRALRDLVFGTFPQTPEIIADFGFDMFVSPAGGGGGGGEGGGGDPPIEPEE